MNIAPRLGRWGNRAIEVDHHYPPKDWRLFSILEKEKKNILISLKHTIKLLFCDIFSQTIISFQKNTFGSC
jgi:hypothetical protein